MNNLVKLAKWDQIACFGLLLLVCCDTFLFLLLDFFFRGITLL